MIHHTKTLSLMLLLSIGLTTACGNNEENNDDNNTNNQKVDMKSDVDMKTDVDMGKDMPGDVDMGKDMTVTGPDADVLETEPNNDFDPEEGTDQANSFDVGKSIGGTLSRGNGENFDQDLFKVQLQAGTVLTLNVKVQGEGITSNGLGVDLFSDGTDVAVYRNLASDKAGSNRQVFIPETGTYYLAIYDGVLLQEEVPTHGGATATYVIETSSADLVPVAEPKLPGTVAGDLNDFKVDALSFAVAEKGLFAAEIFGSRAPIESDLDPALILWNPTTKKVVAENDDIDYDGGVYDSALESELDAGTYVAVVDFYTNDANLSYQLNVDARDDSYALPTDLNVGTPVTGVIGAGNKDSDFIDSDYYKVSLAREKALKITVKADNADLQPSIILVREAADGPQQLGASKSVGDSTAMTFIHPKTGLEMGDYRIIVNDQRNIFDEDSYQGGTNFTYTISIEEVTPTPQAASLPLEQSVNLTLGEYAFYELDLLANQSISITASSTFPDSEVLAGLLTDDKEFRLSDANVATFTAKDAGKRLFALRDAFFRGTYMSTMYSADVNIITLDASTTTFTTAQEATDNNTKEKAQKVVHGTRVIAKTQADPMAANPVFDYYTVDVTAGSILAAFTAPDPNAPLNDPQDAASGKNDADTIIKLINSEGKVVATNDDTLGDENTSFGGLLYHAKTTETLTIVVEPYYFESIDTYFNGHYFLDITLKSIVN